MTPPPGGRGPTAHVPTQLSQSTSGTSYVTHLAKGPCLAGDTWFSSSTCPSEHPEGRSPAPPRVPSPEGAQGSRPRGSRLLARGAKQHRARPAAPLGAAALLCLRRGVHRRGSGVHNLSRGPPPPPLGGTPAEQSSSRDPQRPLQTRPSGTRSFVFLMSNGSQGGRRPSPSRGADTGRPRPTARTCF